MEWIHTLTIIGVNITLIGILATLVIWSVNKLDADVRNIGSRMDSHAARIDQLYRMFCELLKNKKG